MNKRVVGIILIFLLGITVGDTLLIQEKTPTTPFNNSHNSSNYNASNSSIPRIKNPLVVVLSFDYEDLITEKGKENLPSIFRVVEDHSATATFFISGITADRYPESVREIYARGYSVGLHTYSQHFPVFREEDAAIIEGVYNTSPNYVWDRSFKTPQAFYGDIKINQRMIMRAIDNATTPKIFRSPSLVVNWARDPRYFAVLRDAGVEVDSSIYQNFSNPEPFYDLHGIIEVPVTASEIRLNNLSKLTTMANRSSMEGVPFVMFIHPHKLTNSDIEELDGFLGILEDEYEVTYLKVDEVPTYYGTSYLADDLYDS